MIENTRIIDRTPYICAAGKKIEDKDNNVWNTLHEYTVDDLRDTFKTCQKKVITNELPPIKNPNQFGIHTEIKPILQPGVHTRYQTLINDLKETSYESYWNKSDGRAKDPTPGLPKGMDRVNRTMGKPTARTVTMKELINPPKTPYQVLEGSQIGHELYRKSHNDYNVGERINRNYVEPGYDSRKRYGCRTAYDQRGVWARCAFHWYKTEPVVFLNKTQANYCNTYKPKLGQCLRPNNILEQIGEHVTYGRPLQRDFCGVEDLIKDPGLLPSNQKREMEVWLKTLNLLRKDMRMRKSDGFKFGDFCLKLQNYDKDRNDLIPLDTLYRVCDEHLIRFNRMRMEGFLRSLGVLNSNDEINYRMFVDLIDNDKCLCFEKIQDLPEEHRYYLTTNQAATLDWKTMDNTDMPAAGVPTIRYDIGRPVVKEGGCRAHLDNYGDDTSAETTMNPTIYTNYGLNYRDLLQPRSKDFIRCLFAKCSNPLTDELFEELWKKALEIEREGDQISVATFHELVCAYFLQ